MSSTETSDLTVDSVFSIIESLYLARKNDDENDDNDLLSMVSSLVSYFELELQSLPASRQWVAVTKIVSQIRQRASGTVPSDVLKKIISGVMDTFDDRMKSAKIKLQASTEENDEIREEDKTTRDIEGDVKISPFLTADAAQNASRMRYPPNPHMTLPPMDPTIPNPYLFQQFQLFQEQQQQNRIENEDRPANFASIPGSVSVEMKEKHEEDERNGMDSGRKRHQRWELIPDFLMTSQEFMDSRTLVKNLKKLKDKKFLCPSSGSKMRTRDTIYSRYVLGLRTIIRQCTCYPGVHAFALRTRIMDYDPPGKLLEIEWNGQMHHHSNKPTSKKPKDEKCKKPRTSLNWEIIPNLQTTAEEFKNPQRLIQNIQKLNHDAIKCPLWGTTVGLYSKLKTKTTNYSKEDGIRVTILYCSCLPPKDAFCIRVKVNDIDPPSKPLEVQWNTKRHRQNINQTPSIQCNQEQPMTIPPNPAGVNVEVMQLAQNAQRALERAPVEKIEEMKRRQQSNKTNQVPDVVESNKEINGLKRKREAAV